MSRRDKEMVMRKLLYIICILWCPCIIFLTYPEIEKHNNLIAVQWCEKKSSPKISYPEIGYRGIYKYIAHTGDDRINIVKQTYNQRILSFWQPYRIYIETIEKNLKSYEIDNKFDDTLCYSIDEISLLD